MSAITHSQRQGARGQSLVELALVIPLIMLLVAGAAIFGMAMFSKVALQDAALEGAVYGSFDPTNSTEIQNRVRGASTTPIDSIDVAFNGGLCRNTTSPPNAVTVTVTYNFPIFVPYVAAIVGSQSIPLRAWATDTILSPACH